MLDVAWPAELASYLSDEPIWSEEAAQPSAVETVTEVIDEPDAKDEPKAMPETKQVEPIVTPRKTATPPPAPPKPQVDQDVLELQQWLDGRGNFPGRQKLKTGLTYLINLVEDHTTIANPRGQLSVLKYDKTTLPIVMTGTNDTAVDFPAVTLEPTLDHYDFYRACLKISSPKEAEVALTEDLRLAAWISGLVREYQQSQRDYLAKRLGLPIEVVVFHAYYVVKAMTDGVVDPTERAFADITLRATPLLNRTGSLKQLANLRQLMQLKQTIAALFQSFFYINTTTADQVALDRVAASYSFERAVAALNGLTKLIDVGFKVTVSDPGMGKEKALHELVTLLRQAGGELINAATNLGPEREAFGQFKETVSFADGMTVALLEKQMDTLKGLAVRFKVMARPEWQALSQLDSTLDFGRLTLRAQEVLAAIGRIRNAMDVMEIHRSVAALESDPSYRTLTLVREMLHEVESALRDLMQRTLGQQQQFAQRDRSDCEETYNTLFEALEG
jgi:hypothetical protein